MSCDKHRCRDLKVDPRYRTMLEKRGGKKKKKEIEEKGWIDVSKLSRTTIDALRCLSYLIIPCFDLRPIIIHRYFPFNSSPLLPSMKREEYVSCLKNILLRN